eukprot:936962_1
MNEISINIQLKLKENSIKPNPNPITYTTVEYTSKSLTTLINSEEEKQIHKQSVSLDVIVRYKTMQWLESIKTIQIATNETNHNDYNSCEEQRQIVWNLIHSRTIHC